MKTRKILVPVHGSLSAGSIARNAFWLASAEDADLYLVEVITPRGFISRLLSLFSKRRDHPELTEARRQAVWIEQLRCKTAELRAPNLLIGIVESARWVKPDRVILAPELQERMGRVGVEELEKRLGQVSRCTLILPARGLALKIVPCGHRKGKAIDPIKGYIKKSGSVIFPDCWRKSTRENGQNLIRRT